MARESALVKIGAVFVLTIIYTFLELADSVEGSRSSFGGVRCRIMKEKFKFVAFMIIVTVALYLATLIVLYLMYGKSANDTVNIDTERFPAVAAWPRPPLRLPLDPAVIEDFPTYIYPSDRHIGSDCSVCLEDFEDGDELIGFPNCRHSLHPYCMHRFINSRLRQCPKCMVDIM